MRRLGLALFVSLWTAACASRGQRVFAAAGGEQARRALESWGRAVDRADLLCETVHCSSDPLFHLRDDGFAVPEFGLNGVAHERACGFEAALFRVGL